MDIFWVSDFIGYRWKNTKQYNKLSFRYGARLTNSCDGGISKSFYTFVAPNLENKNFKGAYSISVVDESFMNLSKNNRLNGYIIYTKSKSGAKTEGKALTYLGQEVYNRKQDFTIGFRNNQIISEKFHFLNELHLKTEPMIHTE